jgi:hypothetical protein
MPRSPQTIPCSCLPVAWITGLSHQSRHYLKFKRKKKSVNNELKLRAAQAQVKRTVESNQLFLEQKSTVDNKKNAIHYTNESLGT